MRKLSRWLAVGVIAAGFALTQASQAFAGDDGDADSACQVEAVLGRGLLVSPQGDDGDADGLFNRGLSIALKMVCGP